MHCHVVVIAVLSAFISHALADCCTVDDPIGPFRTCSPLVVPADTPFLVKAVNYTRYHDDLGGGTFDPDPRWDSITVWLARSSNRACDDDVTGCVVSGPVCKLIDCFPLSQDTSRATNQGRTLISDFIVSVPGGAGPDGAYYDLASSKFDRHDGSQNFSKSAWRTIPYAHNESSLEYDNNWYGFNLTGTQKENGTNEDGFYPFEVADSHSWPSFDLHKVPCRAYACARQCVHQAWLGTDIDITTAEACIDNCEGVDDVVNYCPDVGGEALTIVATDLGLDSQTALDSYVPDGCAEYEGAAFAAAHSSYIASITSALAATGTSVSASASASVTSSNAAIDDRKQAAKFGAALALMPVAINMIVAVR